MSDKIENLTIKEQFRLGIVTGQLHIVEDILDTNPSLVHNIDENGTTPLILCAAHGYVDVLKHLLKRGANVEQRRKTGKSALFFAAQAGHLSVVQELLKNGASVDYSSNSKEAATSLFIASQCGYVDIVRELVSFRSSLNAPLQDGATPLFVACQGGHTEIVSCLLKSGASVNKCRKDMTSPLWIASQMGHSNVVNLLLYAGATIDQCREDGSTPLFKASHKGHGRVVETLLNHHIKPELGLLKNGQSALHGACLFGHLNIVKLLVDAGAQVNIRNQDGYLPSDLAELGQYNDILLYISSLNQIYSTAV